MTRTREVNCGMGPHRDYSARRVLCEQGLAYFVSGVSKTELFAVNMDGAGDVTDHASRLAAQNAHRQIRLAHFLVDGLIYGVAEGRVF